MFPPTAHYLNCPCREGRTNTSSTILWPYYNVYSRFEYEDQAHCGSTDYIRMDAAKTFNDKWIEPLYGGMTVYQARVEIANLAMLKVSLFSELMSKTATAGKDWHEFELTALNIWSDQAQKIKGAYTGHLIWPPIRDWSRPH